MNPSVKKGAVSLGNRAAYSLRKTRVFKEWHRGTAAK